MKEEHEKILQANQELFRELDKLDIELAAANESIDHYKRIHQEAQQQADRYQRDLCKAEEGMKIMKTMV